jgi:hypothetical protein
MQTGELVDECNLVVINEAGERVRIYLNRNAAMGPAPGVIIGDDPRLFLSMTEWDQMVRYVGNETVHWLSER